MIYRHDTMQIEIHWLVENARHVTIVPERIREVATALKRELEREQPFQTDPHRYPNETLTQNNLDTLQFYFALTSQHFCIWRRNGSGDVGAWDIEIGGERYVGGRGINAALIRALRQGKNLLDPAYLASMTMEDVKDLYRDERSGEVSLQLLPQRLAKFNEIGRVLTQQYRGHVANLLEQTEGYLFRDDGRGLVQELMLNFPIAYFDWPFAKLAILYRKLVNVRNRVNVPTSQEYRTLTEARDPENAEVAADYYIPLFFIRTGIFRVSPAFSERLRRQQLIERNSRMEQEFRACTMAAGRAIAEEIGAAIPVVDEELWRTGYTRCRLCRSDVTDDELPCPYRHLSIGYQTEPTLMEMRWPLVLTTCY
ncbi:MAG: queuosine salvage family protein [Ardenticatenaceae bacterium]|nr:queuosine salvage family protein [Ardenticatenaceae bacterium]HBY97341.1 hypothetical protein [Chloroflexota bacterium]